MDSIESEKDAAKRLGLYNFLIIDKGCDELVSQAIKRFRDEWAPYSQYSTRKNIINLIHKLLDNSIARFINSLPEKYQYFFPKQDEKISLSLLIKELGFQEAHKEIKRHLAFFIEYNSSGTEADRRFTATLEAIINLVWMCYLRRPKFQEYSTDVKINTTRKQTLCELCGEKTELTSFIKSLDKNIIQDKDLDDINLMVLSHNFCSLHKQKKDDTSAYKRAKRSQNQFEIEVLRLRRQVAKPNKQNAMSGDELVDEYFYLYLQGKMVTSEQAETYMSYVRKTFGNQIKVDTTMLQRLHEISDSLTNQGTMISSGDIDKIRNIARRMVDSRITDNKKRMLVLKQRGLSQKEIAQRLTELGGKNITHQAVSKALRTIRHDFLLSNTDETKFSG
ncbi:hypothetical protein [Vibrio casei]|uniref:hypothetical protein n=1 Tax=Vibrio casei TaxID=673372 RepID=UPI003F98F00C